MGMKVWYVIYIFHFTCKNSI